MDNVKSFVCKHISAIGNIDVADILNTKHFSTKLEHNWTCIDPVVRPYSSSYSYK